MRRQAFCSPSKGEACICPFIGAEQTTSSLVVMISGECIVVNNLLFFRKISGVQRCELSFFLHISVHVYHYYEVDKVAIPDEIKQLLSKLYNAPIDDLFNSEGKVSNETINKLMLLAKYDKDQRMKQLALNLSEGRYEKLRFDQIEQIKHSNP